MVYCVYLHVHDVVVEFPLSYTICKYIKWDQNIEQVLKHS